MNPLNPSYKVRDDNDKVVTIGHIEKSSPNKLPERKIGNFIDGCLKVDDIHGTKAGSKRLGVFHSKTRKDFIDPNDISDINGAKCNTIKRGITTNRVTNPQNPSYQIPGASEMGRPDNDPYGGSSLDPRFVAARKA